MSFICTFIRTFRFAVFLPVLVVMGCGFLVDKSAPQTPVLVIPNQWHEKTVVLGEASDGVEPELNAMTSDAEAAAINSQSTVMWWGVFEDDTLNALVSRALMENRDLKTTWRRVAESQALARAQYHDRWPSVSLDVSGERTRRIAAESEGGLGRLSSDFGAGLGLSWQLDWFGQKSQAIRGREARVQLAEAEASASALATVVEVVRQYYTYRGLQQRLRITEQNIALLKTSLALIEARYAVGEVSEFDVVRGRGEYQVSRAREPELTAALRASAYGLAVLVGSMPGELPSELEDRLRVVEALPVLNPALNLEQPLSVLAQRPDVARAEAQIAVDLAQHGVAVSELYPRLTLSSALGFKASAVNQLLQGRHRVWSLGAFLDWPMFDQRTRGALVDAARQRLMASMMTYEGVVLKALAQVESALVLYREAQRARTRYADLMQTRQRAHTLARELYEAGEVDYLSVIDAERELATSQEAEISAKVSVLLSLAQLYGECGGEWQKQVVAPIRRSS